MISANLPVLGRIAIQRTYVPAYPIVTDRVAWSVGLSVGLSVTVVSPAKTAQPIEMPFGLRNRVGPRNRVLDGDADTLWERAILRLIGCVAQWYNVGLRLVNFPCPALHL